MFVYHFLDSDQGFEEVFFEKEETPEKGSPGF